MQVRYFEHVLTPFLQVGQSKGHGLLIVLPIGMREVCVESDGPFGSQDAQVNVGLHGELVIETVDGIKLDGANRHTTPH